MGDINLLTKINNLDERVSKVEESGGGGSSITVDSELSTTSTNPVQNKVITNTFENNQDWLKNKNIWSLGDIVSEKSDSAPLNYVPFHVDKGTYTFSCIPNVSSTIINTIVFLDSLRNTVASIGISSQSFAEGGSIVLEFTKDIEYINSYFREAVTYAKIQLEKGNEKTDYTPYNKSNVELSNEKANNNIISDAWNTSTTYAVGQYCIYNNSLWKCLIQHSGQTPTEGTYWTNVSVANEITSVNNSIENITSSLSQSSKLLLDTTAVTT